MCINPLWWNAHVARCAPSGAARGRGAGYGVGSPPAGTSLAARDPPRAQQHATRAAFFIPGFTIATWAPLLQDAKLRAGMAEAGVGLVLRFLGMGSLLAMPMAGALAGRQGCRRVMLASTAVMGACLPLLARVSDPLLLGLVLRALGAAMGAMDCT